MSADHVLPFFFLNGDTNHDGLVDLRDLYALSNNWLLPSGFDYAKGDFNYDGFVDKTDLTILAQNWQVSLAGLASALPAQPTSAAPRPPTRTPTRASVTPVVGLVFESAPTPTPTRAATRTPAR